MWVGGCVAAGGGGGALFADLKLENSLFVAPLMLFSIIRHVIWFTEIIF